MIDEKVLIDKLRTMSREYMPYIGKGISDGIDRAIETVQNQPKVDGWIPCSERLPETRNNVLLCRKTGYITIGHYSQGKFYGAVELPINSIYAWMPLPEPYSPK